MSIQHISRDDINALPLFKYQNKIVLVNNDELLPSVLTELYAESILGFDTETRPAFQRGQSYLPSVLQLSTNDLVVIFQLTQLSLDSLGLLFDLLGHEPITKAGVAIRDDIKGLKKLREFEPRSFIDIGDLAATQNIHNRGLRGLAGLLLGCRISKSARVSNWSLPQLSQDQLTYAATDAWISRELYLKLAK